MAFDPDKTLGDLTEREIRQRFEGLQSLLDISRALAAEIDTPAILKTIIREACEGLDCDRASLFQYDSHTNELYTSVVTELEIGEIRRDVESGITGYVARHRAIANVPDPAQDARWNPAIDMATGYTTRSVLAAPLVSPRDDSLLGVLQLINKRDGPFDKADEELLEAFSQHAALALDRARLVEQLRRQQQVEASLGVARDIQRGFMPEVLPEAPGYEMATWWYPHEEVGGDYCDVIPLTDGRLGMCVADVTGHGIGPSLIMATVRAALRVLLVDETSPETILRRLNETLADGAQQGRFITMVMFVLDPVSHVADFANAGHGPALHFSPHTDRFTVLEATGLPLGILEETEYPLGPTVEMQSGDIVLLCTDGIVEAVDRHGRPFGQGRLEELIRTAAAGPIAELVDRIAETISGYYVGDSPDDDLTVLALRRL